MMFEPHDVAKFQHLHTQGFFVCWLKFGRLGLQLCDCVLTVIMSLVIEIEA